MPKLIAAPASKPSRRTRKRRCFPSPTVASSPSSQPGASSSTSGLPSPNGARRASSVPPVEVEGRDRAARALPVALGARDEHDRSVVQVDEPRRDDADHALVPALARDDVRAAALVRLGPFLDLRCGLAEDASLDGLALAIQLLELVREAARLVGVVGQEQL